MNTLKSEPKKSTLGRFEPEQPMRGPWMGYLAMACVIGSFILNSLLGWVGGLVLAAGAIILGKLGLDSTGRGMSLVALLLGVVLIGVLMTVLLIGSENIGISPT